MATPLPRRPEAGGASPRSSRPGPARPTTQCQPACARIRRGQLIRITSHLGNPHTFCRLLSSRREGPTFSKTTSELPVGFRTQASGTEALLKGDAAERGDILAVTCYGVRIISQSTIDKAQIMARDVRQAPILYGGGHGQSLLAVLEGAVQFSSRQKMDTKIYHDLSQPGSVSQGLGKGSSLL